MAVAEEREAESGSEATIEEVFDGDPTGVELERADDGDSDSAERSGMKPWDPEAIRVSTRMYSLRNVLDMIRDEDIELAPDFQRNRVWKQRQKSRLIESLLLQIPLPAFYFAENKDGLLQVVDGLQRLSTVHDFVRGVFVLNDLEYLKGEQGKRFDDLAPPLRRRLQNAQLTVHVIEPSTPNAVKYDIFKRLNTGGEPLNAMEIRHCMSRARSRDLLKRCAASKAFLVATGGVLREHIRMNDREAALRFLAFHRLERMEQTYDDFGSLEALLDETTEAIDDPARVTDDELEVWFADFERAMVNARIVFGENAFRKWPTGTGRKSPINRALLESWAVVLAEYAPEHLRPVEQKIVRQARDAMAYNGDYVSAISTSTGDPRKVRTRFGVAREIVASALR